MVSFSIGKAGTARGDEGGQAGQGGSPEQDASAQENQDILDDDLAQDGDDGHGQGDDGKEDSASGAGKGNGGKGTGWIVDEQGKGVDWDSSFLEETSPPTGVMTPTRNLEDPFYAPAAIDLVTATDIDEAQVGSLSAALLDVAGTSILQPAHAGFLPVLRGLSGSRVAILFDGIRLDPPAVLVGGMVTAMLADPLALAGIEIARGPMQVMAGPNAIGGALQLVPALPIVNPLVTMRAGGLASYRYGSADASQTFHAEGDLQLGDAAVVTGLTYSTVGPLNNGIRKQPYTGYDVMTLHLGTRLALTLDSEILFYYSSTRLLEASQGVVTPGGENDGYLRWPRLSGDLFYGRGYFGNAGPFEVIEITLGLWILGERFRQLIPNGDSLGRATWEKQTLDSTTAFAQAWGRVPLGGWGSLLAGVDWYGDTVDADGTVEWMNGADEIVSDLLRPRLPDEARRYMLEPHLLFELYSLRPFQLSAGTRVWWHRMDVGGGFPVRDLAGGAALLSGRWQLGDLFALVVNLTYGTRPPSLVELAGQSCAPVVLVPSPGLDPEGTAGAEIGAKWNLGILEGSLFYGFSFTHDMIMPTEDPSAAVPAHCGAGPAHRFVNGGAGWIHSIELRNHVNIGQAWRVGTVIGWFHGTQGPQAGKGKAEPMAGIPPFMGTVFLTVRYPRQYLWGDIRLRFVLGKGRLSPLEELDAAEDDPFFLLSVRGGVALGTSLDLFVAFENLINHNHRYFGSGIDGPGRSVVVGIQGKL